MSEPFHEANERLRERKRIENDRDAEIERLTAELADCKESDRLIERLQARVEKLEAENKELDGLNYIQAGMLAEAGLAATEQETE